MQFETLAHGYGLIEGPRVDPEGGLYFSDVHGGGVYRLAPDGRRETVVPKRRGVGGIALHAAGGVVVSGRNVCHVLDGDTRILLERDDVGGFNDLFTDAEGAVYVGSLRSNPFDTAPERKPGDLHRIRVGGETEVLYGDVGLTNGIGFSPGGRVLYHSDTAAQAVLAHDVGSDGAVSGRRVFAKLERGAPDGLAVDEDGGVWVASYGGGCALRYAPDGSLDRTLEVPARAVTSLCFGLDTDLVIATADNTDRPERNGTLFRADVGRRGLAAPLARV